MVHSRRSISKACIHAFMLFSAILFFAVPVFSSEQELDELKHAIKSKGARWVADETSVSKLPDDQRKGRLGALKPVRSGKEAGLQEISPEAPAAALASSLDWRNYNGFLYVTPVRNQGNCGSCWAFAATAALESYVLITENIPGTDLNLSEQVLVSCSGAGSCSGGYIGSASQYISNTGLPPEACFPYSATNNSCSNACADYQATTERTYGWHWVTTTSPNADAIKAALSAYGPLVTTMDVYSDFFYYKTGVYSHVSGTLQGGHAILIVGYDDAGGYFVAKNSWGTGWGEAGYFKIAYGELSSVVGFGEYTIAYESTPPPPPPPPACTYSLSSTTVNFKSPGGTASVGVTTQGNCSWTATSNASWITITQVNNGTGSGTVAYSVSPNPSPSNRTGTMTIAGQTHTVKQSGTKTTGRK